MKLFNYYSDIIPNPERWDEVVASPLPTAFWTNTLKTTPEQLAAYLKELAFPLESLAWNPNGFRGVFERQVATTWPYLAGLLQIQEEVSMLTGVLIDAQPGEKILDLCAAPGNKTAQVGVAMQNQGTLVANDSNFNRMRAFSQLQKRLGLVNVSTMIYDATSFPRCRDYFDKVIADVPCTCEGTFRKGKHQYVEPSSHKSRQMANTQMPILKRAIQAVKPGGIVAYSTCTFAPEENEMVVNRVLQDYAGEVELVEINLPNFIYSPGLTQWQGQELDSSLTRCMRVWPHQNNTGGFFVALLRKTSKLDAHSLQYEKDKNVPTVGRPDVHIAMKLLSRFGLPESFVAKYDFSTTNASGFFCSNKDNQPPDNFKLDAKGLFFMKTKIKFPKLTTAAAMLFGKLATKNTIILTEKQLQAFYTQQSCSLDPAQTKLCESIGYVLVMYQGHCLGVGIYYPANESRPAGLQSLFPAYLGSYQSA